MKEQSLTDLQIGPYKVDLVHTETGNLLICVEKTDHSEVYVEDLDVFVPQDLNPKGVKAL